MFLRKINSEKALVKTKVPILFLSIFIISCAHIEFQNIDNTDLKKMYDEDQSDRRTIENIISLNTKDTLRENKVRKLYRENLLKTSNDYFFSSVILQHGDEAEDFLLAHKFAKKAVALNPDNKDAKWMVAATWDRYLMKKGLPQWYGTQFGRDQEGKFVLSRIDESKISDEDRRALGVRTLEDTRKFITDMNKRK